jgi:hypothetical protein
MISVLRFTSHRWHHPSPDAVQAAAGTAGASTQTEKAAVTAPAFCKAIFTPSYPII